MGLLIFYYTNYFVFIYSNIITKKKKHTNVYKIYKIIILFTLSDNNILRIHFFVQ